MAYFSNGTEGEMYRERWCYRCEHLPESDDRDCPIWSAHFLYSHDQGKNAAVKDILTMLIPMEPVTFKDGITCDFAAECSFFRHRTEPLPFDEDPRDEAYERAAAKARQNDFADTGGKDWT